MRISGDQTIILRKVKAWANLRVLYSAVKWLSLLMLLAQASKTRVPDETEGNCFFVNHDDFQSIARDLCGRKVGPDIGEALRTKVANELSAKGPRSFSGVVSDARDADPRRFSHFFRSTVICLAPGEDQLSICPLPEPPEPVAPPVDERAQKRARDAEDALALARVQLESVRNRLAKTLPIRIREATETLTQVSKIRGNEADAAKSDLGTKLNQARGLNLKTAPAADLLAAQEELGAARAKAAEVVSKNAARTGAGRPRDKGY